MLPQWWLRPEPSRALEVHANARKGAGLPWRSVMVRVPLDSKGQARARRLVNSLAKRVGIKPGFPRTMVVCRTTVSSGFYGYLRIYRGDAPTKKEKRQFRLALKYASALTEAGN